MSNKIQLPTKIACAISIPKCASQSMLTILGIGKNRDDDAQDPSEQHVIYENHQRLSVLDAKYELADKYIFAFVRNPYARLLSWYQFHREMEPYKSCTFEQWIMRGCPVHWTVQNATNWVDAGLTPLLQHNFLTGTGTPATFVGRMESFETDMARIIEDLNAICRSRKIDRRFEYQDIRMNRSKPASNSYTDEMKEVVFKLFRADFDAFGYEA